MPEPSGGGNQFSQGASSKDLREVDAGARGMADAQQRHGGLTFSFFLSSGLVAGPGAAGPPRGPGPTSPLRCAALTLGGVMAAAAEVSGMRGRAPGTGGWWPCCGDTAG